MSSCCQGRRLGIPPRLAVSLSGIVSRSSLRPRPSSRARSRLIASTTPVRVVFQRPVSSSRLVSDMLSQEGEGGAADARRASSRSSVAVNAPRSASRRCLRTQLGPGNSLSRHGPALPCHRARALFVVWPSSVFIFLARRLGHRSDVARTLVVASAHLAFASLLQVRRFIRISK